MCGPNCRRRRFFFVLHRDQQITLALFFGDVLEGVLRPPPLRYHIPLFFPVPIGAVLFLFN